MQAPKGSPADCCRGAFHAARTRMTTSCPELPRSRGSHLSSFPAIAGLAERHEALRQAAALPGADPGALLDAAFAELDGAIELLTSWDPEDGDAAAEEAAPDTLTA